MEDENLTYMEAEKEGRVIFREKMDAAGALREAEIAEHNLRQFDMVREYEENIKKSRDKGN